MTADKVDRRRYKGEDPAEPRGRIANRTTVMFRKLHLFAL